MKNQHLAQGQLFKVPRMLGAKASANFFANKGFFAMPILDNRNFTPGMGQQRINFAINAWLKTLLPLKKGSNDYSAAHLELAILYHRKANLSFFYYEHPFSKARALSVPGEPVKMKLLDASLVRSISFIKRSLYHLKLASHADASKKEDNFYWDGKSMLKMRWRLSTDLVQTYTCLAFLHKGKSASEGLSLEGLSAISTPQSIAGRAAAKAMRHSVAGGHLLKQIRKLLDSGNGEKIAVGRDENLDAQLSSAMALTIKMRGYFGGSSCNSTNPNIFDESRQVSREIFLDRKAKYSSVLGECNEAIFAWLSLLPKVKEGSQEHFHACIVLNELYDKRGKLLGHLLDREGACAVEDLKVLRELRALQRALSYVKMASACKVQPRLPELEEASITTRLHQAHEMLIQSYFFQVVSRGERLTDEQKRKFSELQEFHTQRFAEIFGQKEKAEEKTEKE